MAIQQQSQAYYQDQVCIVTGGNSGIGYALSEELLKRGATVYIADLKTDALEKLSAYKDRVNAVTLDVTNQEQVEKIIQDTAKEAGKLDFLFNNAGIGGTIPFETATQKDWETIININLWGVIYGARAAVPIMMQQGRGHIVNTSSMAGIIPPPFQSLYCLTKFGVTGMTEALRYEYVDSGIFFSTICPGNIATPIFKKSIDGTFYDHLKIPQDAIPADEAAVIMLDKVAEQKGIIIVPEGKNTQIWHGYVLGDSAVEKYFIDLASQRRGAIAKTGNYVAE